MAKTEKELQELKEEFIEFTNQIKELSDYFALRKYGTGT